MSIGKNELKRLVFNSKIHTKRLRADLGFNINKAAKLLGVLLSRTLVDSRAPFRSTLDEFQRMARFIDESTTKLVVAERTTSELENALKECNLEDALGAAPKRN